MPNPNEASQLIAPDQQKKNAKQFDLPIPGQSLTTSPGQFAYEQAPQFTDTKDINDYLFNRLTSPSIQRDVLRLLDAGVPVAVLVEPLIMQGVNEGKFNLDAGLLTAKTMAIMIGGLGVRAGIDVKWIFKTKQLGLNPLPFKKAFKQMQEQEGDTEPMLEEKAINMTKRSLLSQGGK